MYHVEKNPLSRHEEYLVVNTETREFVCRVSAQDLDNPDKAKPIADRICELLNNNH